MRSQLETIMTAAGGGHRGPVLSETDLALLAAAEALEVDEAKAKLQAKVKLTGRERMLLKKAQQGAVEEGEMGRGPWSVAGMRGATQDRTLLRKVRGSRARGGACGVQGSC